jgi:1-aminocyclopropane-1-carboxylate deaminase/D-cysteine desulfhydrase-like pyridoxal-dependent ACC family enzyme
MKTPSPLDKLKMPLFEEKQVKVWVKRDDLIHDEVSGNKWRKLKYNVEAFQKGRYDAILTFGGAYSNHILATAKVGSDYQISTIAIIRGEEQLPLNPTLKRSIELGMKIYYISRTEYRKKQTTAFLEKVKEQYGNVYIVPEGGGNKEGVLGCKDIVEEINVDFDYILTDCGTGATLAGISLALKENQKAIGIPVLKGGDFILDEVKNYYELLKEDLSKIENIELATKYHFGGYAKHKPSLIGLMRSFYKETGIKTDPVYTGKLFYGLLDLIKTDYFPKGSKIVVVHTGGLQGISGFEERYKTKIY